MERESVGFDRRLMCIEPLSVVGKSLVNDADDDIRAAKDKQHPPPAPSSQPHHRATAKKRYADMKDMQRVVHIEPLHDDDADGWCEPCVADMVTAMHEPVDTAAATSSDGFADMHVTVAVCLGAKHAGWNKMRFHPAYGDDLTADALRAELAKLYGRRYDFSSCRAYVYRLPTDGLNRNTTPYLKARHMCMRRKDADYEMGDIVCMVHDPDIFWCHLIAHFDRHGWIQP